MWMDFTWPEYKLFASTLFTQDYWWQIFCVYRKIIHSIAIWLLNSSSCARIEEIPCTNDCATLQSMTSWTVKENKLGGDLEGFLVFFD